MFATWLFAVTKKIRLTLNNKPALPTNNTTPIRLTWYFCTHKLLQRTLYFAYLIRPRNLAKCCKKNITPSRETHKPCPSVIGDIDTIIKLKQRPLPIDMHTRLLQSRYFLEIYFPLHGAFKIRGYFIRTPTVGAIIVLALRKVLKTQKRRTYLDRKHTTYRLEQNNHESTGFKTPLFTDAALSKFDDCCTV